MRAPCCPVQTHTDFYHEPGVAVNTAYLASLDLVGRACESRVVAARIYPAGPLDPVRFDVGTSGPSGSYPWTVVIMPVRV